MAPPSRLLTASGRPRARRAVDHTAALAALAALASLAAWTPGTARADSDAALSAPMPKVYRQECASCHTAYPPALLPAASWQRLMANLPRHFGTDASVDAATLRQLNDWIQPLAGTSRRVRKEPAPPPEDRITRSAWFARKHREVAPDVWKRAAIKSPANCMACHTQAEQGDFDDDRVRIPR